MTGPRGAVVAGAAVTGVAAAMPSSTAATVDMPRNCRIRRVDTAPSLSDTAVAGPRVRGQRVTNVHGWQPTIRPEPSGFPPRGNLGGCVVWPHCLREGVLAT